MIRPGGSGDRPKRPTPTEWPRSVTTKAPARGGSCSVDRNPYQHLGVRLSVVPGIVGDHADAHRPAGTPRHGEVEKITLRGGPQQRFRFQHHNTAQEIRLELLAPAALSTKCDSAEIGVGWDVEGFHTVDDGASQNGGLTATGFHQRVRLRQPYRHRKFQLDDVSGRPGTSERAIGARRYRRGPRFRVHSDRCAVSPARNTKVYHRKIGWDSFQGDPNATVPWVVGLLPQLNFSATGQACVQLAAAEQVDP